MNDLEHGATAEQLRSDIDSGRTGDNAPDPAAAPLGTDEEAAGTPIPNEAIAASRQQEIVAPAQAAQSRRGLGASWVLIAFVVLAAAALLAWLLRPVLSI